MYTTRLLDVQGPLSVPTLRRDLRAGLLVPHRQDYSPRTTTAVP